MINLIVLKIEYICFRRRRIFCFERKIHLQTEKVASPPDVLSAPAMHNAYYICHNVQVVISILAKFKMIHDHNLHWKDTNIANFCLQYLCLITKQHNCAFNKMYLIPQDLMFYRGFYWDGAPRGKGKKGRGKRKS